MINELRKNPAIGSLSEHVTGGNLPFVDVVGDLWYLQDRYPELKKELSIHAGNIRATKASCLDLCRKMDELEKSSSFVREHRLSWAEKMNRESKHRKDKIILEGGLSLTES